MYSAAHSLRSSRSQKLAFQHWPTDLCRRPGRLNGNGHLDAFLANGENEVPMPNTIWLNDGAGNFQDSGQQIGESESRYVTPGRHGQ
jgi:hypothetical protein